MSPTFLRGSSRLASLLRILEAAVTGRDFTIVGEARESIGEGEVGAPVLPSVDGASGGDEKLPSGDGTPPTAAMLLPGG